MLAATASASRQFLQRDAKPSIGGCGNRVRLLLTASSKTRYSIRTTRSYGYGIGYNNRQHRAFPSVIFSIKGFLSDSSSSSSSFSSSMHGRSSTVDGRVLFSTSAKSGDGSQNQKTASAVAKFPLSGQVTNIKILRTVASYLWMKDNLEFQFRVVAALILLVGAKVLNVQVPFLFKLAIDWLNTGTGNAGALASNPTAVALFATPVAVLIGYGIARSGASAFNELRTALFSKVALRTIRLVSRKCRSSHICMTLTFDII